MERSDFSPEKFSISGYGQYQPVDTNKSDEGRARNRRVNIILLDFASSHGATPSPFGN
jgi:chemotaxis protein MotB